MTPEDPGSASLAQVPLTKGVRRISIEDATQIQAAAASFLTNNWKQVSEAIPANVLPIVPRKVGEPLLDNSGNVHFGAWLLESRRDQLVLTNRPLPPGTYILLLYLENRDKKWVVTKPGFERVLRR